MSRLIVISLALIGMAGLPGCGDSDTKLPEVPTVDNRPAETKEADDGMAKNAAKVNASAKH